MASSVLLILSNVNDFCLLCLNASPLSFVSVCVLVYMIHENTNFVCHGYYTGVMRRFPEFSLLKSVKTHTKQCFVCVCLTIDWLFGLY